METLRQAHADWENEGGAVFSALRPALLPGIASRGSHPGVPSFLNDIGSGEIGIGVTSFNCIGATPPQDHPHVYLDMGERDSILCTYCATRFRYDVSLATTDTRPNGCFHSPLLLEKPS